MRLSKFATLYAYIHIALWTLAQWHPRTRRVFAVLLVLAFNVARPIPEFIACECYALFCWQLFKRLPKGELP